MNSRKDFKVNRYPAFELDFWQYIGSACILLGLTGALFLVLETISRVIG